MFTPQNGMAGLLKTMGLDPDELKANVEGFMAGMRDQAAKINGNQERLEAQGSRVESKLDAIILRLDEAIPPGSTREILEDGAATGVLITSERFPQAMLDDVNGVTTHASHD